MSTFNQNSGTAVPTLINSSAVLVTGNAASANALTVRQFGGGNVFSAQTSSGGSALFVGANGNVGVGTTSPVFTFDVTGTARATSNLVIGGQTAPSTPFWIQKNAASGISGTAQSAWFGQALLTDANGTQFLSIGTDQTNAVSYLQAYGAGVNKPISLQPNGGYVGIGTTGPVAGLHCWSTTNASLNTSSAPGSGVVIGSDLTYGQFPGEFSPVLHFRQSYYTAGSGSISTGGIAGYKTVASGSFGGGLAFLYCANGASTLSQGMTLTDGGRVGIGTTGPGTPLTIAGDLNYSGRAGQFRIQGVTNPSYLMNIGVDTTVNAPFGYIQTEWAGNSYRNLALNAFGGYVGVGTASPSAPLHVGDGSAYQNGTTTITKLALLDSTVATNGTVNIQMGKASSTYDSFFLSFNNVGASSAANYAAFGWYNGNTVMAIQAQGRVGIGNTNPAYPLHVNGSASSGSVAARYFSNPTAITTTAGSVFNPGIYAAYDIATSASFTAFSDQRAKIAEAPPSESYMNLVDKIQVHQYSWIDKVEKGPNKRIGFFAQEVEEVVPDAVGQTTAVIPTIYREANSFTETTITVQGHGITTEKKLEVVDSENGKTKVDIVRVIDADTLEVKFEKVPKDKLFVVGPEVDDSRMVNHDYLMAVGFGGLKELSALVKTQAQTIETLEARLAALESKLAA